jgi:hypothetical protein
MECVLITEDCYHKISGQNSFSVIFNIFRSEVKESVFWTANHYCLIPPLKRGYSCHKDEKIRYKGVVTVVNKHLDSKTENQTEEIKKKQNQERFKRNKQRRKKIFLLFLI